jgi:hypothetical protein
MSFTRHPEVQSTNLYVEALTLRDIQRSEESKCLALEGFACEQAHHVMDLQERITRNLMRSVIDQPLTLISLSHVLSEDAHYLLD